MQRLFAAATGPLPLYPPRMAVRHIAVATGLLPRRETLAAVCVLALRARPVPLARRHRLRCSERLQQRPTNFPLPVLPVPGNGCDSGSGPLLKLLLPSSGSGNGSGPLPELTRLGSCSGSVWAGMAEGAESPSASPAREAITEPVWCSK